jgi:hypothetical protein
VATWKASQRVELSFSSRMTFLPYTKQQQQHYLPAVPIRLSFGSSMGIKLRLKQAAKSNDLPQHFM